MPVKVPLLAGRSDDGARNALIDKGLTVDNVTYEVKKGVRPGLVISSNPEAGQDVPEGSNVSLVIAKGSSLPGIGTIPMAYGFFVLALVIMGGIIWGIWSKPEFLSTSGLGNSDTARGLITFLVAFTTAMIGVILVLFCIVTDNSEDAMKRADFGKQIFMAFIGILGTVIGFYYGVGKAETPAANNSAGTAASITTAKLEDGEKGRPYNAKLEAAGLTGTLTWAVSKPPPLPAGLNLEAATGVISGTPTVSATKAEYTFSVKNNSNPPVTATKVLALEIK